MNLKGLDDTEKDLLEFNKNERDKMEQEIEELRRRSVSGGVVVWWCGVVVVWWCGVVVVWWCGGVVVWWCGGVVVWWCGGVVV